MVLNDINFQLFCVGMLEAKKLFLHSKLFEINKSNKFSIQEAMQIKKIPLRDVLILFEI